MARPRNETGYEAPYVGDPKPLAELNVNSSEIERVSNMNEVELEAFMNEEVEIFVHPAREAGELDVAVPSINGINQPIIRGVATIIKRKYVEALARCHVIKYEQRVQDSSRPENIQMIERKVPVFPFDIRRDTAKGKEWFKMVYASI